MGRYLQFTLYTMPGGHCGTALCFLMLFCQLLSLFYRFLMRFRRFSQKINKKIFCIVVDKQPSFAYNNNAGRDTLYTRVTELTFKRYVISSPRGRLRASFFFRRFYWTCIFISTRTNPESWTSTITIITSLAALYFCRKMKRTITRENT